MKDVSYLFHHKRLFESFHFLRHGLCLLRLLKNDKDAFENVISFHCKTWAVPLTDLRMIRIFLFEKCLIC